MIRGIAFDLEGTIIDVESLHFDAFVLAAEEVGITISFEEIVEKIPHAIGGGDRLIAEGIARLGEEAGPAFSAEEILEAKRWHYSRLLEEVEVRPRPGFLEVFEWITVQWPVAIGSLTPRAQAEVLLRRSGLDRFFPASRAVLLEDVGEARKKPAPDVYLETARRIGIDSSEQLVFEDSPVGVKAARAAGSLAIGMPVFRTPENVTELLEVGASRVFLDWREMNLAAVIANLAVEAKV